MKEPTHTRAVSTDALETLGQIHTRAEKRDAIHLAVEPVVATGELQPGEYVTVVDGEALPAHRDDALGIVDPFLPRAVRRGERFWFVMLPRAVHSLRHVWTHPSFPDTELGPPQPDTDLVTSAKAQIREMAADMDCSYERLMEGAEEYASTGEYLHFGFDINYGWDHDRFWRLYEVVTGKPVGGAKGFFFSCSC
jgi:hypothetical protein